MPRKYQDRTHRPGPVKVVAHFTPEPPPIEDEHFHQALKEAILAKKQARRVTYALGKHKGQIQ